MEIWDLYTAERKLAGIEHIRGNKIADGYYHLAVHVWIKNSDGKFLISQLCAFGILTVFLYAKERVGYIPNALFLYN